MKKKLRELALAARREAYAKSGRAAVQKAVLAGLEKIRGWREAKTVLSYASFRTEMPTEAINSRIIKQGKTLALPMTMLGLDRMQAGSSGDGALVESRFGTLEPDPRTARLLDAAQIDFVLVPGVAFDRRGHRLGYGMGYYDKFLPSCRPSCVKVGLAFEKQIFDDVRPEEHDVRMDFLATEKRLIWIEK